MGNYSKEIQSGRFKIHYKEENIDGAPVTKLIITNGCPQKLCLETPYHKPDRIMAIFKKLNAMNKSKPLNEESLVRVMCSFGICNDPEDIYSQKRNTQKYKRDPIGELDRMVETNSLKEITLEAALRHC